MFPIPVANRRYRFQTGQNRSKNDVSVSKTSKSVYFAILNWFLMFSYTNRKLEVPSSSRNGDIVKKVPNRSNFKFSINLRCFQDKIEYQVQENFIFFRCQQDLGAFSPVFSNGFNRKMVFEVTRGHSTKNQSKNCIERCERLRKEAGPPIASNKSRGWERSRNYLERNVRIKRRHRFTYCLERKERLRGRARSPSSEAKC